MADILENPVDLIDDAYEQEIQVEQEMIEVVAYRSYNQLDDKPQINGVELVGNKTSSDLGITAQIESAVNSEAQTRVQADNTLQNKIDTEKLARQQADSTLQGRIDAEGTARQQADNGLQSQIDAITSKSDVVDVVANYAALQAYDTSSLGNNDVIKVLDDETHEDALTYYRWSTTTQTWSYIGQEAPYYSKGQMDVMLQGKQDTLTAGANIQIQNGTISATDTTYTAGNGLNLNDTEFSADTDVLATKEDLEGYYTKPETDNLLAPKLEAEVVAELPTTGTEGKLYLTPKAHTTQTATGNPITATVAEDAGALESFRLDGDTFQQSYDGKNLYDYVNASYPVIRSGIEATLNADGSITVTGLPTSSYVRIVEHDMIDELEDGATYTLSSDNYSADLYIDVVATRVGGGTAYPANTRSGSASFTVDKSAFSQYRISILTYTTESWGSNSKTITRKFQLEKSASATDFEPYVGGVPSPNPDYPQPIQTVTGEQTVEILGKNLANIGSQASAYINFDFDQSSNTLRIHGTANNTFATNSNVASALLPLPAGTYTISLQNPAPKNTGFGLTVGGTRTAYAIVAGNTQRTITVSGTITRIDFYVTGLTVGEEIDFTVRPMFEAGSTATSYAPYSHQTLPLDLGDIELNGLGDDGNGNPLYKDRIYRDGEDWKVHKATSKLIFDGGAYSWSPHSTIPGGFVLSYNSRSPLYGLLAVGSPSYQSECSHFAVNRDSITWTGDGKCGFNTLGAFWCVNSDVTTLNDFLAWMEENNPELVYPLATPTDTVITDQTLIAQLEAIRTALLQNGTNTITNTATGSNLAGDMEIGYYGFAPRNRYDKWLWLDINNEYEQIGS